LGERRISRSQFIRLGAVLGLGSAGASIAAACGAGDSSRSREAPVTTRATDGPEVSEGEAIVAESKLEKGSAFPFTDAATGQPGVLVRTEEGELVAYSAVCTHQRCTVAYQPETQKLVCPCHGSVFDPADGAKVEVGPAQRPLPNIPVEVRGGEVVRG
jgi:Rieske Fe-S protein